MIVTISQGNIQENINSRIISKLYNLAINQNNTVSYSGNLYSSTGYGEMIDYLNTTFGPDLVITVPTEGRFIKFVDSNVESALQYMLGLTSSEGITETMAGEMVIAAGVTNKLKSNLDIINFPEFKYFTYFNTNPPAELFRGSSNLTNINLSNVTKTSNYEFSSTNLQGALSLPRLTQLGQNSFAYTKITDILDLGTSITAIPAYCFRDCTNLQSVVIPDTVITLGQYAFYFPDNTSNQQFTTLNIDWSKIESIQGYCFNNQTSLVIDATQITNVQDIGNRAFYKCFEMTGNLNLTKLASLGESAFSRTKIANILCLNKITTIPYNCFGKNQMESSTEEKQALKTVYLPYECTSLGTIAFAHNTKLSTVKKYTQSIDQWVEGQTPASQNITGITQFGDSCFTSCQSLQIDTTSLQDATSIGQNAFNECILLSGALYCKDLISLGSRVFRNTAVTSVKCLGTISSIEDGCFQKDYNHANSGSLTEVYLPYECTQIKGNAFNNSTGLITLKQYTSSVSNWVNPSLNNLGANGNVNRVTSIGNSAFYGCSSLQATFDFTNVTSIGDSAFYNCTSFDLGTTLSLPNLTTLGDSAFRSSLPSLTTISNLGSITELKAHTFFNCSNLKNITFPSTLTSITISAFYKTQVEKIIIPEGVTQVDSNGGSSAIMNDIKYIEIPSTCTDMGHFFHTIFNSNPQTLPAVVIKATTPPSLSYYHNNESATSTGVNRISYIYVPHNSVDAYRSAIGAWKNINVKNKIRSINELQNDNPDAYAMYMRTV